MRTRMRTSATRPGRSDIRTKKRHLCVFSHIHSRPRSATRAPCSRWATSARTRRCAPGPERAEGSRRSRRRARTRAAVSRRGGADDGSLGGAFPERARGALELALRRAVAHASQYPGAEGRSTASLRSALGFERADVRSEADDLDRPRFRDAETCRPEPRRKDATRQNDVSSRRDDDDDDDDGSPRFAFLGDVVEADAGVRCLTRFPRERPTPARAASGRSRRRRPPASCTSSPTPGANRRVRHGTRDGAVADRVALSLDDAHAGSCSIYALAWAAADADGGARRRDRRERRRLGVDGDAFGR